VLRPRVLVPLVCLVALTAVLAVALAGREPEPARERGTAAMIANGPPGASGARPRRPPPRLTTQARIRAAIRWAEGRLGTVAFAVVGGSGRTHGLRRTSVFPSASLVKTVLMVAELRRANGSRLEPAARARIEPMIVSSDNNAAFASYNTLGKAGLVAAAGAAGLRDFAVPTSLFDAQVTAADQARLLLRIDRVVPPAHRRYARRLLSSIVSWQRWGIAPVARERGYKAFFKGGWRTGLAHQAALLERGGRRIGLAVLTSGSPSQDYGIETIRGIAARVLR
jgi:hypothetical protein